MIITEQLLDQLTKKAQESPRLRMNMDLRNSEQDTSQRMLNALEPGTVIPIHRHPNTSETVVILRGRAVQWIYDDKGYVVNMVVLDPKNEVSAMNVEKGCWHQLESIESGTVILECKDGPYEPIDLKDILNKVE